MSVDDVSHAGFDDYDVLDLDEELYRAFLELREEWSKSYQRLVNASLDVCRPCSTALGSFSWLPCCNVSLPLHIFPHR
ncbi:hypothetical protein Y032_0493g2433 [Ancylostoma ceylanicum]|uniref:Uncharacterized protein n=1 Tax=Ancylostoma ceylanicum TaxID=53326 RepID=A0A016WUH3_9BILA|nr:hypothetical protein Y032_0493g2433 [Ancylostoma ceylanicum]